MDVERFKSDTERLRARHSECVDLASIQLAAKLRDAGIPFNDDQLVALPSRFVELMLQRLESYRHCESEAQVAIEANRSDMETKRQRLEQLVESTDRVRGEVRIISEKISAALSENRRAEQLERERQRERDKELRDLFRKIEKKELELRLEVKEEERLRKMLKKVTK